MGRKTKADNYEELKKSKKLAEKLGDIDTSDMSEEEIFQYLSGFTSDVASIEEALTIWAMTP